MIRAALYVILFFPLIWFGCLFGWRFYVATGSWWERFLAAGKESATMAWAQLVIIGTTLMNAIGAIATVVADPDTAQKIKDSLPSEYVAGALVAIMLLTMLARLRSLTKDDD